MRAQKERGRLRRSAETHRDGQSARGGRIQKSSCGSDGLHFYQSKGLENGTGIIALRDPKMAKYNVEDLLDQRILKKVVESGYVEEIERRYKIRS